MNFGTIPIGSTFDHIFTITNSGEAAAVNVLEVGMSGDFAFTGGTYPGTGGTCPTNNEILGLSSCTVQVTYTPTNLGLLAQTMTFNYFDGVVAQAATRDIQGTGVLPAVLEVSDAPIYSFGSLIVGQVGTHVFTINNTGGLPATAVFVGGLAAPYSFTGGSFPGVGGTCGTTIIAGGSCTVSIDFTPAAAGTFP